jgi:DNA-binding NarL/FixJ family response regulator
MPMDGNARAGQTLSSQPGAEECTRVAAGVGETTPTAPHCGFCAHLRARGKKSNRRPPPLRAPQGLHVAFVGGDRATCLVARQMVQAQRDGWTLEVYLPSCPVRETARRESSSRPPEGDHGPGNAPDVVLISVMGREDSRLACVRKIKGLAPALPVLIISGDSDPASIVERCAAGADGYVLKSLAPEELARAVALAAQGWPAMCREAQKALLNVVHRSATATTPSFPGLTGREREIAGCLVASQCDKEISTRLGIAEATVHVHLVRLYRKLGVHSRQQAVAKLLGVGGAKSNPF